MYIHRTATTKILDLLSHFPVVGIIGPRQVGKTTLAKKLIPHIERECLYLDLELPEDFSKLHEPQIYLEQHQQRCVILDEIQQLPNIFKLLRALVDRNRIPSRFIILGSASPDLLRQSSESLAGRIAYVELHPLNLTEIHEQHDIVEHWFKGGFPQAFLTKDTGIYKAWIRNFIQTYLERDLPNLGLSADPVLMRRLWTMVSHYHGGIWNASKFANSLDLTVPTVNRYIDFLEAAFILHRLSPFYLNIKKRLVKSPKLYIRDSGILHFLAGITDFENLQGHVLIGNSWEGYAIEQIKQLLPEELSCYYYRTHQGTECDLVLVRGTEPEMGIEIKYTAEPKPAKGFINAIEDLGTEKNYIITPKSETYPLSKTMSVCSLKDFILHQMKEL